MEAIRDYTIDGQEWLDLGSQNHFWIDKGSGMIFI